MRVYLRKNMGNFNILVVDPNGDFHQKIHKELSELRPNMDRVEVHFARTGHEACIKYNKILRFVDLILFNSDTLWINGTHKPKIDDHDFLHHIQAPCRQYVGETVIISDLLQTYLHYKIVRPSDVVDFICSFVGYKKVLQKSLA